jgi:hypothetical protein
MVCQVFHTTPTIFLVGARALRGIRVWVIWVVRVGRVFLDLPVVWYLRQPLPQALRGHTINPPQTQNTQALVRDFGQVLRVLAAALLCAPAAVKIQALGARGALALGAALVARLFRQCVLLEEQAVFSAAAAAQYNHLLEATSFKGVVVDLVEGVALLLAEASVRVAQVAKVLFWWSTENEIRMD